MYKPSRIKYTNKNWLSKLLAGLVLGLLISIGVGGLILKYNFGDIGIYSIQGQFLMWITAPLWLAILSICFLFRSGVSAWFYLGAGNMLIWIFIYKSSWIIS